MSKILGSTSFGLFVVAAEVGQTEADWPEREYAVV